MFLVYIPTKDFQVLCQEIEFCVKFCPDINYMCGFERTMFHLFNIVLLNKPLRPALIVVRDSIKSSKFCFLLI